jgi:hypothetical protein
MFINQSTEFKASMDGIELEGFQFRETVMATIE